MFSPDLNFLCLTSSGSTKTLHQIQSMEEVVFRVLPYCIKHKVLTLAIVEKCHSARLYWQWVKLILLGGRESQSYFLRDMEFLTQCLHPLLENP